MIIIFSVIIRFLVPTYKFMLRELKKIHVCYLYYTIFSYILFVLKYIHCTYLHIFSSFLTEIHLILKFFNE